MIYRRALLLLLLVLSAWACSQDVYDWEKQPSQHALPAVFRELSATDVQDKCGRYADRTTHGCVDRDYTVGLCYIYTGPSPQRWLMTHELMHCAGFDHG